MVPLGKPGGKPSCPLITFDPPNMTFYYNRMRRGVRGRSESGSMLGGGSGFFYPWRGGLKRKRRRGWCTWSVRGRGVVRATRSSKAAEEGVSAVEMRKERIRTNAEGVGAYTGVMNPGTPPPPPGVQCQSEGTALAIGAALKQRHTVTGHSTWHFRPSGADLTRGSPSNLRLPPRTPHSSPAPSACPSPFRPPPSTTSSPNQRPRQSPSSPESSPSRSPRATHQVLRHAAALLRAPSPLTFQSLGATCGAACAAPASSNPRTSQPSVISRLPAPA
ncbi:hypothetical protein C4D60_Mb00t19810 [Musa balbisiana]|uniref:Uncharacterized protein n=1 Tax=Musa balbisiana TaxID=52838 RepID=A0A4S8I3L5_MUSBA|nr:hypothetical protein C4D60_Mb00t19810 [Musa balbisiana]